MDAIVSHLHDDQKLHGPKHFVFISQLTVIASLSRSACKMACALCGIFSFFLWSSRPKMTCNLKLCWCECEHECTVKILTGFHFLIS